MAGTFSIHNTLIWAFVGSWHNTSGSIYSTPDTGPLGNGAFGLSVFSGQTINIDGVDHNINDIPPGFRVLTANWAFTLIDGQGSLHGGSDGVPTCTGTSSSDGTVTIPHAGAGNVLLGGVYPPITIFQLLTDELVISFILVAGTFIVKADFSDLGGKSFTISGTYDLVKTSFTLETKGPLYVGDKVKVSSDVPTKVDKIHIDYNDPVKGPQTIIITPDSYYIIVWGPFDFWFYLPIELGTFTGNILITFFGSGTQFSGSVALGLIQLLYEDASGIYRLLDGQTHDTLYFRAGNTTDIKQIMLQDITNDDSSPEEDFFSMMPYPSKAMSASINDDDDDQISDFTTVPNLRTVVVLKDVEIPSPFAKTAFLP